ncbi:MAG: hypothetical protein JXA74_08090 [Anaerolineae bacterium]|nr:hypothetical protein [Anaerolineae bacterium]
MTEKNEEQERSGIIRNMGILDLTWAESPEDLAEIKGIENVGVVRVRDELYPYVVRLPMHKVGVVERTHGKPGPTKELTGNTRLTGAYLAAGEPDTTLSITGTVVVMPPLEAIGFKELRITGMLILPEGSEALISPKLGNLTGQILYLPADAGAPRFFNGKESVGAEFLELLPEPAPWIVNGSITIEEDVTRELLRAKVPMIILNGRITAPKALLPTLQVLAVQNNGQIRASEESAAKEAPEESPWGEKE